MQQTEGHCRCWRDSGRRGLSALSDVSWGFVRAKLGTHCMTSCGSASTRESGSRAASDLEQRRARRYPQIRAWCLLSFPPRRQSLLSKLKTQMILDVCAGGGAERSCGEGALLNGLPGVDTRRGQERTMRKCMTERAEGTSLRLAWRPRDKRRRGHVL
ncbi:hypothetical protein CALVIDRAFT_36530 [Calocera viscosa TUFC12733]|uniref:Uncharacterized protein n=1 Tax=Calocera viscosa (strain TUFC12733) TaxID=1330018 RepID=A0A167NY45_CALVF|nr:hypothetical protein CALVIDRAFT_36530 [Calocera viscosa TUFC12733]